MSRALPPRRESGAVLLLILLCLTFGALAWSFGMNPPQRRALETAEKLARAREALLGYAVLYPEARENRQGFVPGHLPCPDIDSALDNEGTEAGNCGSKGVSALGHFPWRSLGIPPQKDDAAECLWYLVSGNHKAEPKADLLNPDTAGLIEIVAADGKTVLAEQVVAVLFAPGAPLPGQTRRHNASKGGKESECRRDYDARQYLDRIATIENDAPNPVAEGITRVLVGNHETVNDRLVWITKDEWAARLQTRLSADTFFAEDAATDALMLTQRIAACLMRFGAANEYQRLPWAVPLEQTGNAPETFHYSRMTDQKNRLAGRPPYSAYNSVKAIGASAFAIPEFKICADKDATHSSCRWLIRERCPDFMRVDGRPDSGMYNSHNGWWDKWKDHFFYLVAPDFAPAALNAGDCETMPDGCLRVAGTPYAAAVIFAGEALAEQKRAGKGRMEAAQYLEGENATTIQYGGKTLTLAGNDQISCIAADADGLRLVANCGRQDCRASFEAWLACQEKGGSCALPNAFSGCACYGAVKDWQDEGCTYMSPRPLCRRIFTRLQSCA